MRKTNPKAVRPVQHSGGQCARLRDKCELTRQGIARRKTRIQCGTWHQRADAVRSQHAQQMGTCGIQHGLLKGDTTGRLGFQASAQHNGCACALAPQRRQQIRHGVSGCANNSQIWRKRQGLYIRPCGFTIHLRVLGIDRPDRPLETRQLQVVQDH